MSMSSAPPQAEGEAKKSSGLLSFLYEPEKDINYTFILTSYVTCTVLCGLLYLAEHLKVLDAVKGYWVVFAPFVVMLPWAVIMRARSLKINGVGAEAKEKSE